MTKLTLTFKAGTLTMKQLGMILLMIAAGLAGFMAYCFALIDWVQDLTEGVYATDNREALVETSALLTYTYLAVRFMLRRFNA